ncbi:MAG: xanthine dehydrogenase family protein subunit M [Chloroflexi bacterium]|nr:xanthine dehydrogenase family protein subunit M [Chloroflexota bacterium]
MKVWNRYHTPSTIDEALQLLADYNGAARVVAGGTDLLIELREGARPPQEALVDITFIPELISVHQSNDHVLIGAAVTHDQITKSPLLNNHARCLVESCGVVGGPQVRNVGTIGGNVAHALPAGDGTISLVALDSEAEIILSGERQWVPIADMFVGPGKSLIDPTRDLLLGFRFKVQAGKSASAFERIMRPQGVALPIMGCAVSITLDDSSTIFEQVRICVAPTGPVPSRLSEIEDVLLGQEASEERIEAAISSAYDTVRPRTSKYRATADYRREVIPVLLRRTLHTAISRARQGHRD